MFWYVVIFLIDGKANHVGLEIPELGVADLSLLGARIYSWNDKKLPKGERLFFKISIPNPDAAINFLKKPGLLMNEIIEAERASRGWHLTADAPDLVRKYHSIRSIDENDMNCVEWIVRALELGGVLMPMDVLTPTDLLVWCKKCGLPQKEVHAKKRGRSLRIFATTIKRVSRNRLRRIMRGYRFLKESNQLGLIAAVTNELANVRFIRIDHRKLKFFFGAGAEKAELIIRQKLFKRNTSFGLNKALLYSLGANGSSVIYPMPRLWQEVVARYGFRVARMRCSLAWIGYIGIFWGYGVLSIAKYLCVSLYEIIRPHLPVLCRYAYFEGLTAYHLPQPCRDSRSHDIITWYAHWEGKAEHLDVLCHGVENTKNCNVGGLPVVFNPHPLPPLDTLAGLVRFAGWAFTAVLRSIFDLLKGRWWSATLLVEFAKAAMIRFQMSDKLARDYMFHISGWIYRPLWTYEAEKKGSRIIQYFYSTNYESFKDSKGYPLQTSGWPAVNWPLFLVWDEGQADFVRRAISESGEDVTANIKAVGPIWFQSSSVEMPELPVGSVAVFDVQPFRSSRYQTFGLSKEYYIPKIANQFLLDIHTVIRECKGVMVHKCKRNVGKIIHPKYENLVKILAEADNVFQIEPEISVIRAIEGCFAVISMPFTSTALLGRELGKPSVFYDPYGIAQKDDRAAHGIQVLCGKDELRDWLIGLLGSVDKVPMRVKG